MGGDSPLPTSSQLTTEFRFRIPCDHQRRRMAASGQFDVETICRRHVARGVLPLIFGFFVLPVGKLIIRAKKRRVMNFDIFLGA